MMEAKRIGAARHRLWRAWVFGGLLWSIVFIALASLIAWLLSIEKTTEIFALLMAAMVLALGTFAIFRFAALIFYIGKRAWKREPIMETED